VTARLRASSIAGQRAGARLPIALLILILKSPGAAAADTAPPPAPDYSQPAAWAAWPGRPSDANLVAPGLVDAGLPEKEKVDVFFIHPTTYLSGSAANARFDEPGAPATRISHGVLRFQASVFNACCRIYAPRYRQANISAFQSRNALQSEAQFELAYGDVLRAFDHFLAHENHGRPFIIASHSQGSLHAMRLLQERIAGTPAQRQLIAAYVIGYEVPLDIEARGVPICRSATQTGCLIGWNTMKESADDSRHAQSRLIWLAGRYQPMGERSRVCVNPLNWTLGGSAAAALNVGALPGVPPESALLPPIAGLTGAHCDGGALRIAIPLAQRRGFADALTLAGSYHVFDYNIFYSNIRVNARERIRAFHAGGTGSGT
jgi:Protein of unknown function (DUF3089)